MQKQEIINILEALSFVSESSNDTFIKEYKGHDFAELKSKIADAETKKAAILDKYLK